MNPVLTPEQAKAAGYSGWTQHMDHMACIAPPGSYCATCQSPMRALLNRVTDRNDLRHLRSIRPPRYPPTTATEGAQPRS